MLSNPKPYKIFIADGKARIFCRFNSINNVMIITSFETVP